MEAPKYRSEGLKKLFAQAQAIQARMPSPFPRPTQLRGNAGMESHKGFYGSAY